MRLKENIPRTFKEYADQVFSRAVGSAVFSTRARSDDGASEVCAESADSPHCASRLTHEDDARVNVDSECTDARRFLRRSQDIHISALAVDRNDLAA